MDVFKLDNIIIKKCQFTLNIEFIIYIPYPNSYVRFITYYLIILCSRLVAKRNRKLIKIVDIQIYAHPGKFYFNGSTDESYAV